jgi:hypothetical protein
MDCWSRWGCHEHNFLGHDGDGLLAPASLETF